MTQKICIWTVSNCEFNTNFLTFLGLYHMLFALETIGVTYIIIWWLIFEKKSFQFWREIWIWVVVILLQLYCLMLVLMNKNCIFSFFSFQMGEDVVGVKNPKILLTTILEIQTMVAYKNSMPMRAAPGISVPAVWVWIIKAAL